MNLINLICYLCFSCKNINIVIIIIYFIIQVKIIFHISTLRSDNFKKCIALNVPRRMRSLFVSAKNLFYLYDINSLFS